MTLTLTHWPEIPELPLRKDVIQTVWWRKSLCMEHPVRVWSEQVCMIVGWQKHVGVNIVQLNHMGKSAVFIYFHLISPIVEPHGDICCLNIFSPYTSHRVIFQVWKKYSCNLLSLVAPLLQQFSAAVLCS